MAYHFSHIAAYCGYLDYTSSRGHYLTLSNEVTTAYVEALEYLAKAYMTLDEVLNDPDYKGDISAMADIINARIKIRKCMENDDRV